MRLDHLLAGTALASPLSEAQDARLHAVLRAFGFTEKQGVFELDDTFAWVTVAPEDGLYRVHVASPVPSHLVETLVQALDGFVREAGLVRIDVLTRRALEAGEWARRLSQLVVDTPARGRL
jgi:hypothetical protein